MNTNLLALTSGLSDQDLLARIAALAGKESLHALASGALSLTSVRLLSPHLTPENHEAVLARAGGRSRREVPDGRGLPRAAAIR